MKLAKFQVFCLSAFVFVFMEALLRANFYAFGYNGEMGLLSVTLPSGLALLYALASVYFANRKSKYFFILLILLNLAGIYMISHGVVSPLIALTSIVCSYTVSLLIFQRTGFSEIFILGSMLLGVDLLTAGQVVVNYIILYLTASLGLYIILFYVNITGDKRIRKGTLNFKIYKWITLMILMFFLGFFAFINLYTGASAKHGPDTNNILGAMVNKAPTLMNPRDSYGNYWGKLDNFELQGEIRVQDDLIMSVKTSKPGYIRAETADYYTGRGWKNSLVLRSVNSEDYESYIKDIRTETIEQKITLSPDFKTGVIFSIGNPTGIDVPQGDLATDGGGNFYIYPSPPGLSYYVYSETPETNNLSLTGDSYDYPAPIKDLYLQLPAGIPDRVKTLALSLTQNVSNNYERVKIIETYLKDNYKYDLKISPAPLKRDVTDYFLFELKRGYCTYHSTAMVVMLRSIGIPARWVKGFTLGEYNGEKDVYEISLADAHSWVEVYFPRYGWLTYEPTPGFNPEKNINIKSNSERKVKSEITTKTSNIAANKVTNNIKSNITRKVINKVAGHATSGVVKKVREIGFAVIAISLSGILLINYRKIMKHRGEETIESIFDSFQNLMGAKGFSRLPFQTPLEYAKILMKEFKDLSYEISRITEIYIERKYSGRELKPKEVKEAELILRRIRDNI